MLKLAGYPLCWEISLESDNISQVASSAKSLKQCLSGQRSKSKAHSTQSIKYTRELTSIWPGGEGLSIA